MIIRLIIDIAVPSIATYLASEDFLFVWLIKVHFLSDSFDIALSQKVCLFISIIFTAFVLNAKILFYSTKADRCKKEINGLYNVIKQFAQSNFMSIMGNTNFHFDLRIFVPEIRILSFLMSMIHIQKKEKWFVIRNIEPFAKKDITEHLRFRVEPDSQGLVGDAYKLGSIVYDGALLKRNDTNYSLSQTQVSRTSNLLWSICVPILNEKNEVMAVMAFDSDKSPLDIDGNKNDIRSLTNTLAIMMRDSVPELFKKKWSI